ncbi:MAG: GeoRSP system PqqD family peptide chaperone [Nitrospirota bacterium]
MRNIRRNPDIIWREEDEARNEVVRAMERGEDASGEGTVLLVESGMMHQLNLLGGEIWKLLDGIDEERLVDKLAMTFDVDSKTLSRDVHDFLIDIDRRGWLNHE